MEPGDTSSSSQGASSTSGAGAGSTSGAGGATSTGAGGSSQGVDCGIVPELIDNLLEAAATCAPEDPGPHCQDVVDGYCCPVAVESISSPSTLAYLDFLELTKKECPALWKECEVVDCAFPENPTCVPSATDPMTGLCVSNP